MFPQREAVAGTWAQTVGMWEGLRESLWEGLRESEGEGRGGAHVPQREAVAWVRGLVCGREGGGAWACLRARERGGASKGVHTCTAERDEGGLHAQARGCTLRRRGDAHCAGEGMHTAHAHATHIGRHPHMHAHAHGRMRARGIAFPRIFP
eukprot:359270-Chlamydomonas_euryale.AAC.8